MARALIHEPGIVGRWQRGNLVRSGCDASNRCVAAMYGPSGTHCVLTSNAIDPKLNRIPAGEEDAHAA
jgi:hypothetical protein